MINVDISKPEIEIFQITYNSDRTEGRGKTMELNTYFTSKSDAIEFIQSKFYADKYGIMGTKGSEYDVKKVQSFNLIPNIYESIRDFENNENFRISKNRKERLQETLEAMSKEQLIKKLMK